VITERHRHRYKVNNNLIDKIENAGLKISGRSIDGSLVEMVEISSIVHCCFSINQNELKF
jgi:CTP synthase